MLELYMAIALFGLGSYFNTMKNKEESKAPDEIENIYEKKHLDEVPVPEEEVVEQSIPRDFTELLDEKTRQLYEEQSENPDVYREGEKQMLSNLTGEPITKEQFMTNSNGNVMVPFFGGNIKQNMAEDIYKTKLETFTGRGDSYKSKKEVEQFFAPVKNLSFINGSDNNTSLFKERFNTSRYRSNELPFEQINANAPGLGQNYAVNGKGGFHQYEMRDYATPKTIDEMRVKTNPRITYKGRVVSGKNRNDARSNDINVSKYRPDKFYENNEDRYFKTTGAFLRQKMPEIYQMIDRGKKQSRETRGSAAPTTNIRPYNVPITQDSKRNMYMNSGLRNVNIENTGNHDYGKSSFKSRPNERDITSTRTHTSNLVTAVKAIITPLQDALKRTKKENVIGNNRPEGNMNPNVPKKMTVYDPNDIARTTIKEQTENNNHTGNMNGPKKLTVYDPNDIARTTIKETLIHDNREGQITPQGPKKVKIYDYDTAPKVTIRETLEEVDFKTNLSPGEFSEMKARLQDKAKTTIREQTENNTYKSNINTAQHTKGGYLVSNEYAPATIKQFLSDNDYTGIAEFGATTGEGRGYLSSDYYAPKTIKEITSDNDYTGVASSNDPQARDYTAEYNAITNANKELISKGRAPTQNNVKIVNGEDTINMEYKKQMSGVNAERTKSFEDFERSKGDHQKISDASTAMGQVQLKQRLVENGKDDNYRNENWLVKSFTENPYTQSLHSIR
jgi:hypothetical protein